MIRALPAYGEKKSLETVRLLGIAESRRIRGLGPKQVESLIAFFG